MTLIDETLDAGVTRESDGVETHALDGDAARDLGEGAQMGRYIILRKLGAGGMGMVYLCYDPELDRKVALKLLRGGTSAKNRQALLREAQAMARLTHPNVVAVHDVGEHHGRVYVAMEFVAGDTLGRWLAAERRSWREVLEVFLHAGRGLHAAHARDLIHRDFKPDNIMVSHEGHVLVMDFGLARPSSEPSEENVELGSLSGSVLNPATVGRLAGTPAYMAPEQIATESLSPAADQFAFCVSIWEGVCGQRPFEGESLVELLTNIYEGRIRSPPASARLPRWLERVLRRGLEPSAKDRWPSMAELLTALDRGRRRWRWQVALGCLVAIALVAATVLVRQHQRIVACEDEGAKIDQVWNAEQRERIRSGLLATEVGFAQDSIDTLTPWLNDYRDAWSSGRTEACLHGSVEGDWDTDLRDRSGWCFEDRRLQLEATVEQIATSNATGARRAVRIASYLDPVAPCLDPTLLRRLPVPPLEMRDEILSIRATLTRSDGLRYAGEYTEALEVARPAVERAEALGWSPLLATARLIEGRSLQTAGHSVEADATLIRAYFEAQEAGSVEVAFRAARSLVLVLTGLQRHREAKVWSQHADVLSSELVDPSGLDEAERHYLLMGVYRGLGDYEAAAQHGEQALAMRADALGANHPITAAAMRNLGMVYLVQERPHEALELFERSSSVWEDAVGHQHPYVAFLAVLRGRALLAMGRPEQALALQQEGLAIFEQVLAAEHPRIATNLHELGKVYTALGRLDDADEVLRRAWAIRRERFGPRHWTIAGSLLAMSVVDRERGRYVEALDECAQALEILERSLEPGRPEISAAMEQAADVYLDLGRPDQAAERRSEALARRESARGPFDRQLMTPLVELGDTLWAGGELDEARRSYERARSIGERALGPEDPLLVPSLTGLAEVALGEGDAAAAVRYAEQAVRIVGDADAVPRRAAAGAHFALARALVASGAGGARARAGALAQAARDEAATAHDELRRAEIERWLTTVLP